MRIDSPLGRVGSVVRKEIIDSLRDRRTLLVMLFTAVGAGPILLMLIMNLAASQVDKARTLRLPVAGQENAPALMAYLARQQVELYPAPEGYEAQVRTGDLDIALEIDARFAQDVESGKPGVIRLIYDRSRDRARITIDQTESLLRAYNRDWGQGRLLLRGVAPAVANPLQIEAHDLATPQSSGSLILFMIAYYGLFAAVMGGMAAAIDTTAGERERQSLEPLLLTPARPLELATGKWLAISALNASVVIVTLAGFYLTLRFFPLPAVGVPFLFGVAELARFLIVLAPLMLLMPAVLLYVGSRGRTFKEAQANTSVLLFVVSIIPVVQLLLQAREPAWLAWVPISGQYALLGRALRGDVLPVAALFASYVVPVLLTALALAAVARLLSRESVLAGR